MRRCNNGGTVPPTRAFVGTPYLFSIMGMFAEAVPPDRGRATPLYSVTTRFSSLAVRIASRMHDSSRASAGATGNFFSPRRAAIISA